MCVPILRSIGTKLTNLENMKKSYVLFDVTLGKNGTSYVMDAVILQVGISIRNILIETNHKSLRLFRFKSYGSNSGFHVFL